MAFVDNVEDALTFKILKDELSTVLQRSVVGSATISTHMNERVILNSDVQETLETLNIITGVEILSDNQPKQRSRNPNDEVSNRARSKTGSIDQSIEESTRSRIQFIHNSGLQGNIFLLNDAIKFEDKRKV
jgi:hypothetical protein